MPGSPAITLVPRPMPVVRTLADQRRLMPPDYGYAYFEGGAAQPFRPRAQGFDGVNAWWLSELCFLVYLGEPEQITRRLRRGGFRGEVRFFGFGRSRWRSTQCVVVREDDVTLLAFRGTLVSDWGDVAADLLAMPCRWAEGSRVHLGFARGCEEVWDDLHAYLAPAAGETPRPLWVTGHSLGAAVATLFADRYRAGGGQVAGLYTFGSPKVGDRGFAEHFNVPAWRVTNGQDPCPLLPPGTLPVLPGRRIALFRHVGEPVWFDRQGRPRVGDVPALSPATSGGVPAPRHRLPARLQLGWRHRRLMQAIADHAPRCYSLRLWNRYFLPQ